MKFIIFLFILIVTSQTWAKKSLQFDCGGFEPSFSLKIRGQKITFASPSIDHADFKTIKTNTKAKTIQINAKSLKHQSLDLLLTQDKNCVSDGVGKKGNDTHKIEFTIDKEAFSGCCKKVN